MTYLPWLKQYERQSCYQ